MSDLHYSHYYYTVVFSVCVPIYPTVLRLDTKGEQAYWNNVHKEIWCLKMFFIIPYFNIYTIKKKQPAGFSPLKRFLPHTLLKIGSDQTA